MAALLTGLGSGQPAKARDQGQPPQTTDDGLVLQQSTKERLVYVKPGVTLTPYGRVSIVDCDVEFEKDWQRDYNRSLVGFDGRVTDKDVARMKQELAAEFKKVFTDEFQNNGYQVVDQSPGVLVLRPALANVEVAAPDVMTADIGATIVRSAGQMMLYLELWDSSTNTIIARIMDARADDNDFARVASKVTNKSAADRILHSWAKELREHLDAATGKVKASD